MKRIIFFLLSLMIGINGLFAQDLTIDSTGNVGIGTVSPTAKLDVFTASGDALVAESPDPDGYAGYFLGNARVTGTLTVDGLLTGTGLGDITSVSAGTGLSGGGISGDVTLDINFNYAGSLTKGGAAIDLDCTGCVSQGELDFSIGDAFSLDAADGNPADAVFVDNEGNVGIGSLSPAGKLDVIGDICLDGVCRTSWPTGSGTGAFIDSGTTAYYNGGHVGIGTSTPQGLTNIDSRVLHILHQPAQTGDTAAGLRMEIENTIDAGIMSAHRAGSDSGLFVGTLSNHRVGLGTNGNENMTIAPNGNVEFKGSVGIGTLNPLQLFHVQGDAYVSGNLGIGIDSPTEKLQVSGTSSLFSSGSGDFRLSLSKNVSAGTSSLVFQDNFSGRAELGLTGDNNFHIKVSADGSVFNDVLFIDSLSGMTGIGTMSPDMGKLNVVSTDSVIALFAESIGDTGTAMHVVKDGIGNAVYVRKRAGEVGSALVVDHRGTDPAAIVQTSIASDAFIVESTGNVGIGTALPQSTLQVNGYTQLAVTSGTPPAADCDEETERGRMKVDSGAGLLYICVASGWVSK